MRDFNGRSINTLLLETKVYKLLQVRVIETAIRQNLRGKHNFNRSFMSSSTSYQLICKKSVRKVDTEERYRSQSLSFNRKDPDARIRAHPFSYRSVFSRMAIIYVFEIALNTISFSAFEIILIYIWQSTQEILETNQIIQATLMKGGSIEDSGISEEDLDKYTTIMKSI